MKSSIALVIERLKADSNQAMPLMGLLGTLIYRPLQRFHREKFEYSRSIIDYSHSLITQNKSMPKQYTHHEDLLRYIIVLAM